MKKPVIPVVFAANDDYAIFCYIAIYSMIQKADGHYFYHIYILQTNISSKNLKMLESLSKENIQIECINISQYTLKVNLKESLHLSVETYYRLFIPLILPQYEKIIYLDSDMCIQEDVSKLYECDLNGYPVGAVSDLLCYPLESHSREIGGLDCRKVFNAGVLVIDSRKFEEWKIREKCLALLEEDYQRKERKLIFADQDALNIVLYENYFQLDKRWNYQPQYLWRTEEVFPEFRQEYVSDQENAFIMHFAGDRKPWKYPDLPCSDIFWKYAKEIKEFKKVISCIMSDVRAAEGKLRCFEEFQFPYAKIPFRSRIAIYAAGAVGKAFCRQMSLSKYAELVLWVDRSWENIDVELGVKPVEEILHAKYDYLIIAIDSERVAKVIKDSLLQMDVPENKIVWDEYRKRLNG